MSNLQIRKSLSWIALASLCLVNAAALAQEEDLRLPISLDADSTDYDGKSSMLMFRGLRLSQGNLGIQADEGRASKLDFEDSVWHFSGNVIIDVENGHIESDVADLTFSGHELKLATITGVPATFEMRRPDTKEITYAEAGRLDYDFTAGVVAFSEQATITEGGNQISSNYLVYNIIEQRINAQSGGDGDAKVRITYTPAPTGSLIPGENEATDDSTGAQEQAAPEIVPEDSKDVEHPGSDETTSIEPGNRRYESDDDIPDSSKEDQT
jgi:lipopolysaccharide export system protein LptA